MKTKIYFYCPKCGSEKIVKYGKVFMKIRGNVQRYKCNNCGYIFTQKVE